MKSSPRHVLQPEYDFDFSLVSITSNAPDYTLCILLNRLLGLELAWEAPLEMNFRRSKAPLRFSFFAYENEEDQGLYQLVANRSSLNQTEPEAINSGNDKGKVLSLFETGNENEIQALLIPELAQADFLFLIKIEDHQNLAEKVQTKLKNANFVQSVQLVEPGTLPSRKNIII